MSFSLGPRSFEVLIYLLQTGCCIVTRCSLCRNFEETSQYILFYFHYANKNQRWFYKTNSIINPPSSIEYLWIFCTVNKSKKCSFILKVVTVYIFYYLWKARKWDKFRSNSPNFRSIIQKIQTQLILTGTSLHPLHHLPQMTFKSSRLSIFP